MMPAENGSEGLRLARERLPDVITLDVCMPGMTGLEFARELRSDSRLATIPILIVTMVEEVDPELREISAGCHQKPVELARFLEVLVRVTGC